MKRLCLPLVVLMALGIAAEEIVLPMEVGGWRVAGGRVESVVVDGERALRITGPATLESEADYPVGLTEPCRLAGEFLASGGIHRFGVRCFVDGREVVPEIVVKAKGAEMTLRRPCRAEDCDLFVDRIPKGVRRQYALRLMVGEDWVAAELGRFFEEADGGRITLYGPVGRTLPTGTKVLCGYRSEADIYFGGVMRGMGVWRSFDCQTMRGLHNHDYHQRRLHPATKRVRILIKANERAGRDGVLLVRRLVFTPGTK